MEVKRRAIIYVEWSSVLCAFWFDVFILNDLSHLTYFDLYLCMWCKPELLQTLMKCIWGLQLRNRTICRLVLLFRVMSTVKWFRIANLHGKRAMICVRTLLSSICKGFGRSEFLLRSPPNPISSNNVSTFGPFVLSQLIIAWYLVKQKEKKTTSYCIMLH